MKFTSVSQIIKDEYTSEAGVESLISVSLRCDLCGNGVESGVSFDISAYKDLQILMCGECLSLATKIFSGGLEEDV